METFIWGGLLLLIVVGGAWLLFSSSAGEDTQNYDGQEGLSEGDTTLGGKSSSSCNKDSQRDAAYRTLMNQLLGDKAKAKRLIDRERKTHPEITETEAIQRVCAQLIGDSERWK